MCAGNSGRASLAADYRPASPPRQQRPCYACGPSYLDATLCGAAVPAALQSRAGGTPAPQPVTVTSAVSCGYSKACTMGAESEVVRKGECWSIHGDFDD